MISSSLGLTADFRISPSWPTGPFIKTFLELDCSQIPMWLWQTFLFPNRHSSIEFLSGQVWRDEFGENSGIGVRASVACFLAVTDWV